MQNSFLENFLSQITEEERVRFIKKLIKAQIVGNSKLDEAEISK